ncbi:MocR-like transcription factor YczR [Cellulomonas fengjieae]|uniref:PLP-dependent aminotransferase family protein n=1 Tax=Cellulomonas fengjieae TaxID=2819978 RepID=A0ABS3SEG1_9CELL|nr:PLP-dependent aminotransferase family protein [Cellulomonas fengjieae]MBO3084143.1 PLP-dependent aminotransferase family protein [Cellulomonas fengjieae]QVI64604.1 PLP-dependent aminotransferase family protein [Cellulomonas fengjieae]
MPTGELPVDRRISGHRLAAVLGAWQRPGPAYVALADAVRAAILSGSVPLSTRLPSERELAEAIATSRTTTTATYDVLRDEGYLVSRRGSGTVTTLPGPRARVSPADGVAGVPGVVDLGMAAPSAPSSLHGAYLAALEALPRYLSGTGYAPLGITVLREAIARWYTLRGTPTTPDQVLVTTGAQQAIDLLVTAHAGPGDRVVVEHPTYTHAIDVVRAAGARPVPAPSGQGGLDIDLLESTLRQVAPRLVYLIPAHRNPTGTSLSSEDLSRVRALARRYRTTIVGDEVLTELTMDGPAPASFPGDGTAAAYVVSIGSASKAFWGGLRVGWVRAHPDLVARLASTRSHADIATAVLEQLVVAELLAQSDELLAARRVVLRERRDLLVGLLLDQLPSWRFEVPAGGLALWTDLGAPVSSALAATSTRYGVRVLPGTAFGVDGSFERNLRLPFTTTPDELRRAVAGLADAWGALGVTEPSAGPAGVHAMV